MIRRWSCLIDLTNNFDTFKFFKRSHKINLFKASVNFKRFNFKITKFKRKSLIRLKHKSNWLIYTNIVKFWVRDYMFNKQYLRYQFHNKITLNNFFFYNFNFIKNRNETFFYNFNFIFSTFSNKKYYYYFKTNSFFKNSPITLGWYTSMPILNNSIIPVYNSWDNLLYTYESKEKLNYELDEFFYNIFSIILNKNIEIKKILIILFYEKIYNFKKLNNFVFRFISVTKKHIHF